MASVVHSVAANGFGKGTNELYDRARPSYQPYTLEHIKQSLARQSSLNVVEIGSGTGIFTKALLAHPDWQSSIAELRAIEPSEGMREVWSKNVQDSRATVIEGTFDTTHIPEGWADLIVIAQAFHWCPDYNTAAAEFARVLKPDGVAVCIWNLEDRDGTRWVAQLRDLYEQHEKGTPQFRLGLWRQTFETTAYKSFFLPPEEKDWSYSLTTDIDRVVDRVCSKSYVAVLPEKEKQQVISSVKEIVEQGDDKKWIDKEKGSFEYPYKVLVVAMKRQQ